MTDPTTVLIVDDHASFAESLTEVLSRYPDIRVVGTAGSVAQAVTMAADLRPEVILMDQRLPDGAGSRAAAQVFASGVQTAIVMLTGEEDEGAMLDAVRAGVSGYLVKTARIVEIVDAVRRAAAGELLIPAGTLSDLLMKASARDHLKAEREAVVASLTPREREVLRRMASRDTVETIAEVLGISRHTVRGYMQTIIEKLGAHSRLEAVLKAQEFGLLER